MRLIFKAYNLFGDILKQVSFFMFKVFSALFVVSIAVFAPLPVVAKSVEIFYRLADSGQYEKAFEIGTGIIAEEAGNLGFEFAFAEAAWVTGHTDDAIFALERILWVDPGNIKAKFMLAEIYTDLGAYELALEQAGFVLLASKYEPEKIAANDIIQRINRVQKRALTFAGSAGMSVGYTATDFSSQADTDAASMLVFADLAASWNALDKVKLVSGVKLTSRSWEEQSAGNNENIEVYASARLPIGASEYEIGQRAARNWNRNSVSHDLQVTSLVIDHTLSSNTKLTGVSNYIRSFTKGDDNDSETLNVKLSAKYKIEAEKPITLFGGVNWLKTDPYTKSETTKKEVQQTALGGNLGAAITLRDDLAWSVAVSYIKRSFGNTENPRVDSTWNIFNGLNWRKSDSETISVGLYHRANKSNHTEYGYDQNQISLSYTKSFGG